MRARFLLVLAVSGVLVVGSLLASGCRPDLTATPSSSEEGGRAAAEGPSTTVDGGQTVDRPSLPSALPGRDLPHHEVTSLFIRLACDLAPLPVYGLVELPPQASIASEWWPAIEIGSPAAYDGPPIANPRVSDAPAGFREAQVLLKMKEGWLMIIENFRGDLGDVRGVSVGEVEGRPADMYQLSGGVLVQWSDREAWYGVFGRGVEPEVVLAVARGLRIIPSTD